MGTAARVHQLRADFDAKFHRQKFRTNGAQAEVRPNRGPCKDRVEVFRQVDLTPEQGVPFIDNDNGERVPCSVFNGQVQKEHIAWPAIDDKP